MIIRHTRLLLLLYSLGFTVLAADQQTTKDEGVSHGKSLIDGVRNLSTGTDATATPGYQDPTTMPEYQYYNSQNVSGMQTDATVDLSTGAANDAADFAWQQSTVPKLQFNQATDPILTNAETISSDAISNPGQITTTTGDCAVAQVSNTEPRMEHCTAWMIPTQHSCDKTVNVDVTWKSSSNCVFGTTYNQASLLHNMYGGADDYVYARALCNTSLPDDKVSVQVHATDGDLNHDCTSWKTMNMPTNVANTQYTGVVLRPSFIKGPSCTELPVFNWGHCGADGQCSYVLTFHEVRPWKYNLEQGVSWYSCPGTPVDLSLLGYTVPPVNGPGKHCVARSSHLNINFTKPKVTKTPIVAESIDNQCANLEAQMP